MQNNSLNLFLTTIGGGIPPRYLKSDVNKPGQNRCYHCLNWVEHLGALIIAENIGSVAFGLCPTCFHSFQTLPPSLQISFQRKCERNVETALGRRNG